MSGEGPLILVVEDEPQMRRLLRLTLESNGMRFTEATTGRDAVIRIGTRPPDIIFVDLGLPDRDGLEVIREVRRSSTVPIIVLSARSQEADKIAALDAGADDYVAKPFSSGELLARLRVALRHAATRTSVTGAESFTVRDLHVDLVHRRVSIRDVPVHLTPTEYRLLQRLVSKAGQVVTHGELLTAGWGPAKSDQHHYLRIYMAGLRRKLEIDPARPTYVLTEIGVGYRLAEQ
jgi:two-component system, OmpR family, KDP operon response regulator KdpE